MDKESKGFIKLDRNIFDHWIFQDAEKFRAFVDLIQLARWKDEKLLIGNDVVTVPRGSYYTSELKLAERWSWSRKKTREFLKLLENEKMIIKKGTTKGTMLTVENYRLYQDEGTAKSATKEHQRNNEGYNKRTSKEQRRDNEGYTKEEIKEIKEIKEGEERKEGKENTTALPSLSFPTPSHKKIYDETTEATYRTWFIDTVIEETDKEVILTAPNNFIRDTLGTRFKEKLYYIFRKEIVVN